MAYEEAIGVVNDLHDQVAQLAQAIFRALADNSVSAWEGMQVGMKGMTTATAIMALIREAPPTLRDDILYVLEHGEWHLPEGPVTTS